MREGISRAVFVTAVWSLYLSYGELSSQGIGRKMKAFPKSRLFRGKSHRGRTQSLQEGSKCHTLVPYLSFRTRFFYFHCFSFPSFRQVAKLIIFEISAYVQGRGSWICDTTFREMLRSGRSISFSRKASPRRTSRRTFEERFRIIMQACETFGLLIEREIMTGRIVT